MNNHFDLMIENPDLVPNEHSLTTWQISQWPFMHPQMANQIPPHRKAWLDLEGPVSGKKGIAKRVCRGRCVVLSRTPDQWIVRFRTVDLKPEDPTLANAWTSTQPHIDLSFEKCGEPGGDDCWQVSVL